MINGQLLWWLERSNQLADEQNGFRWKRSTHDCLHSLSSRIRYALECQETMGVLHMDICCGADVVLFVVCLLLCSIGSCGCVFLCSFE